jgi:hypothetical protein
MFKIVAVDVPPGENSETGSTSRMNFARFLEINPSTSMGACHRQPNRQERAASAPQLPVPN